MSRLVGNPEDRFSHVAAHLVKTNNLGIFLSVIYIKCIFPTETQSDLSDFEGRIRALNEELRRRKTEADKLKRERKKKRREIMKNKEESLKKQIEVLLFNCCT